MVRKVFQWLFKRRKQDLIELITLCIGLLVISMFTPILKLGASHWYWIISLLILILIVCRMTESILGYFFHKRNRKVSGGYFVLVIVVMALINTYIRSVM
ncbi:hypothetical protein MXL46_07395 [Heyndrickxia sporothermodurans]|uniref:hypothetical protein n=1 Tax=Heyndrickxia sporothermodurans TaxID=46224 RepID=UPI000D35A9FC|nr:hypothetical protein [Heyndrickxia sporothermodurans]MBL5766349.1 hypothetical protein [Heyndrickxia sporothermodurans]MBL5769788.1 hypothetical protein [Heyndrickxia sporothermodurans]MBL5773980.1 hypothetical protein [Heyndrickxia sporothermodurans]MBL5776868.1 hypothetical protein [Heyndrickxia sporothermodurans]MBL5781272.1 hypothetical protein [Heyndrickxia sporothermodurans]